jgi:hypothetical protein
MKLSAQHWTKQQQKKQRKKMTSKQVKQKKRKKERKEEKRKKHKWVWSPGCGGIATLAGCNPLNEK